MKRVEKIINITLLLIIIIDIFLCLLACGYPGLLQKFIFGKAYPETLPLLVRLGATWGTFFVLQSIALIKWKRQPMWLPLIAGVRLTEACADWFYLIASSKATVAGYIILTIIPLVNISLGVLFIYLYHRIMKNYRR